MTYRLTLTFLWLVALLASVKSLSIKQPALKTRKPLFVENYVIAPELFREDSFTYATLERIGRSPPEISVEVWLIGRNSSNDAKCTFSLTADEGVKDVNVSSIRRLADKKVLLTAYDELKDGDRYAKLIYLELNDCSLSFPMPEYFLPKEHTILASHGSDAYNIVVGNKSFCGAANTNGRCMISVNGTSTSLAFFDVDFDWSSLHVAPTSMENVLVIRGLDPFSTYKLMLYYPKPKNGDRKELLSLRFAEKTEVMSSDLGICWISEPGTDTWVKCLQYDLDGKLVFDKVIRFAEPMTLLSVQNVRLGKILLITGKAKCEGEECRNAYISEVYYVGNGSRPPAMFVHVAKLECSGDRKRIVFGARKIGGAIVVRYACEFDSEFVFGTVVVTDQ